MTLSLVCRLQAVMFALFGVFMLVSPDAMMASFNVGGNDMAADLLRGMSFMVLAIAYISWQVPTWAGDNLKTVGMFFAIWHVLYLVLSAYQMSSGAFPSDTANIAGNLGPDVVFAILFFWKSRADA
jgi:hypothetical protein